MASEPLAGTWRGWRSRHRALELRLRLVWVAYVAFRHVLSAGYETSLASGAAVVWPPP